MAGSGSRADRLSRLATVAAGLATFAASWAVATAPAYAAGTVSSASPAVVANTANGVKVTFVTSDVFPGAPAPGPTVILTNSADSFALTETGAAVADGSGTGSDVTATFDFAPAGALPAGPGYYDVEICEPVAGSCASSPVDDTGSNVLLLTSVGKPGVTGLSASRLATNAGGGDDSLPFTVDGTNFAEGDTVSFQATGTTSRPSFTVDVAHSSPTVLVGTLTGLSAADPATYDVVVTDTAGQSSQTGSADQLQVVSPPSIVSSAFAVGQGAGQGGHAGLSVTLKATDFPATDHPVVTVDGTGVAVTTGTPAVDSVDSAVTDIPVTVFATADAATGSRTLTLTDTTDGGTAALPVTVNPAPSASAVTPAVIGRGAVITLTLSASNIDTTTSVVFGSASGVTSGKQTVDTGAGTITVPVTVSPTAPLGAVAFGVVRASDAGSQDYTTASPLSIDAAPVLDGVDPGNVGRGVTNQSVTLTGTDFQDGMTASAPSGSGVTVTDVTVASATQATALVTVGDTAPLGYVPVTLTNPDGGTSTNSKALTVDAFSVTGVSPLNASNGADSAAVSIKVNGANIPTGDTELVLSPTFAVTGQDPIVVAATSVTSTVWSGTANLAAAAAGAYQVRLVNGTSTGTCACTLQVTSAGAPTVTAVSPPSIGQGGSVTLVITGTDFAHGASVSFSRPTDVQVTGPVVVDSTTKIEVPVSVAADAATGVGMDVTVSNTGDTPNSGTCSGCLSVTQAPFLGSFSPAALGQGAQTTLTINGAGFVGNATVTFSTGITATGDPVVTDRQIQVPVAVAPDAPSSVTVTVTNPDNSHGSATYGVDPGPTVSAVSPHYASTTYSGTLVVTGSGFAAGATVAFPAGSGVAVASGQSPTVDQDGARLTVPIEVQRSSGAAVDVRVVNPDLGGATCAGCLVVAAPPADPTGVHSSTTSGAATVGWTDVPAGADGGAPIAGYTVTVVSPTGIAPKSLPAAASSATFTGLTPATGYRIVVVATNAAGLSSPGADATVATTTPNAPRQVGARAGDTKVTVSWSAPSGDGSAAIDHYTLSVVAPSGSGVAPRQVTPSGSGPYSATFSGLRDGTRYTFAVVAHDAGGDGLAADAAATPALVATLRGPSAPFTLGAIRVSWAAQSSGVGIAYYQVRYRRAPYDNRFGGWVYPSSWQHLTTTRLSRSENPGWTDCFSVRARDSLGNLSAWSGQRCSAVPLDDRSLTASSGWVRGTGRAFYHHTFTLARGSGGRLRRTGAVADRLALVATRCPTCGVVRIYDGRALVATVRLHASTLRRRVLIVLPRFRLRSGAISIRVVSSGEPVQIDGLGITRA